jgi:hypothetical protein
MRTKILGLSMSDRMTKELESTPRYDALKIKLQLENFTGKTVLSVFQDSYASMFFSKMAIFAKYVTDAEIQKDNADRNLDYEYKTNVNVLIGKLKDNIILAMTLYQKLLKTINPCVLAVYYPGDAANWLPQ